jgi:hypothetical protein
MNAIKKQGVYVNRCEHCGLEYVSFFPSARSDRCARCDTRWPTARYITDPHPDTLAAAARRECHRQGRKKG